MPGNWGVVTVYVVCITALLLQIFPLLRWASYCANFKKIFPLEPLHTQPRRARGRRGWQSRTFLSSQGSASVLGLTWKPCWRRVTTAPTAISPGKVGSTILWSDGRDIRRRGAYSAMLFKHMTMSNRISHCKTYSIQSMWKLYWVAEFS